MQDGMVGDMVGMEVNVEGDMASNVVVIIVFE
jgi:hypothetical protein